MNKIEDKLTTFHWFHIILTSIVKSIKKFFYNFICFIIHHDFYVISFWMHYTLFIISMVEIKLFAIVNWIFDVLDFLRLFMTSVKYGLILLRYSETDSVLFQSSLLLHSIKSLQGYFLLYFLFNTLFTVDWKNSS